MQKRLKKVFKIMLEIFLVLILCALLYVSNTDYDLFGSEKTEGEQAPEDTAEDNGFDTDDSTSNKEEVRLFVRYSANADGSKMTETRLAGQKYVGVTIAKEAPSECALYTWIETNDTGFVREEDAEALVSEIAFDASDFQIGSWSMYDKDTPNLTNKKRVCSVKKHKYPFDVYVRVDREYRAFACLMYEDGTYGEKTLSQEFVIPANTTFTLTIQDYWCMSDVEDVAKYVEKLTITANPYAALLEKIENGFQNEEIPYLEVKAINHTGWWQAPENTLAAYKQSCKQGFAFVECDIRFTADEVPVLLHDETINRTGRKKDGTEISETVNIGDITLEEARTYDFGIWRGDQYSETAIPTLAEFLILCKRLGMHPYIDVKDSSITQEQANAIYSAVKAVGAENGVSFLVCSIDVFDSLQELMPKARYGFVISGEPNENTQRYLLDMHGRANTFADCAVSAVDGWISFCKNYGIPVEVWTIDEEADIVALDCYVSGVTSNKLNAENVMKEYYLK